MGLSGQSFVNASGKQVLVFSHRSLRGSMTHEFLLPSQEKLEKPVKRLLVQWNESPYHTQKIPKVLEIINQ